MTVITFLLKDDPFRVDAGDTRISRLIIEIATEAHDVRALALSQDGASSVDAPVPLRTIPSPRRSLGTALVRNAVSPGRSLLHGYFRAPELIDAIREDTSEVLVAEHTFMAESALGAGLPTAERRLLINTHALQSPVLASRRGILGTLAKLEAKRTWRDELRCVRAADSAACLGNDDLERLREAGMHRLRRLDLLLPPAARPARAERPRALFFGTRTRWPPNAYALEKLLELWPRISREVGAAELIVAGQPGKHEQPIDDPSVRVVGYVDDLDELLSSSSVLLAPVPIGGGVRVKILDAARHGLAAVGTPEAIGTIGDYLPVTTAPDDDQFCAAAVELLSSPARAREAGEALFEANRSLWDAGFVHEQIVNWVAGC